MDYYKSMNAGVAIVPFVELYEGMLRGTVDAISAPFSALDTYQYHEVVDYLNVPGTINPMFGLSQFLRVNGMNFLQKYKRQF